MTELNAELNTVTEPEDAGDVAMGYEAKMLKRGQADFTNATEFLHNLHAACVTSYEFYHNAAKYEDLKKKKRFPMPFFQEQIDTFAAYLMDKLFYKDQPCRIVGRDEDTKDEDVTAKQELMSYQDTRDDLYGKIDQFARDVAMYRVCVAQVDYVEKTVRRLVGKERPLTETPEQGFMGKVLSTVGLAPEPQPVLDPTTGQPAMESYVTIEDVPVYRGPKVKRIDPIDFFITQDKESMDDGQPIMIRSWLPLSHFKKGYLNYEKLKQVRSTSPAAASDGI